MNKILKAQNIYSILFLALSILGLCFLWHIVLMIAASYFIASLLEPLANFLSSKICYRTPSVLIVFILFWGSLITLIALGAPIVYDQSSIFISKIPQYNEYIQTQVIPGIEKKIGSFEPRFASQISDIISSISNGILTKTPFIIKNVWNSARAIVNLAILFILLPIINFYFLKDKDLIHEFILKTVSYLNQNVQILIKDCSQILGCFAKGQLQVCLIMIVYYCSLLTIIGIDLSLIMGFISGISIIAPLVGILFSFILSSIVTLVQFGFDQHIFYVCIIYCIGQICEGYIISPKVIGNKIGLHPIIIILSLMVWSHLLGTYGLFIGVPLTSIIKTFINNLNAAAKKL